VVISQAKDAEYEELLKELATLMPLHTKNSKKGGASGPLLGDKSPLISGGSDPLVKILDYKQDMCAIIDTIQSVDVFRSIDIDLPDNYLNNA
jgi:hypothetical protein